MKDLFIKVDAKNWYISWSFFTAIIFGYFGLAIFSSTTVLMVYGPQSRAQILLQMTDYSLIFGAVEQLTLICLAGTALYASKWRINDFPISLGRSALALTAVLFLFLVLEGFIYEHVLREWLSIDTGFELIKWGQDFSWSNLMGAMKGGNLSVPVIVLASLVIGLYEELIVLGFVVRFMEKRGDTHWVTQAVIASTFIRVSYHTYQGVEWLLSHMIMGLLFVLCYLHWRNLAPFILVHALVDTAAFMAVWKGW